MSDDRAALRPSVRPSQKAGALEGFYQNNREMTTVPFRILKYVSATDPGLVAIDVIK